MKSSEQDLLKHAPSAWARVRLKTTIQSAKNGIWGAEPDGKNDILCVRVADFDRQRSRVVLSTPTFRAVERSQRKGRVLAPGDLLLEKSGGGEKQPVGAVVLYDHQEPAVCSNFVARLVPKPDHDSRFLCYVHDSLYGLRLTQRSIKQTTGIQNLDADAYFNERVCIPPFKIQAAIADFLDRKTAAIDELIAKKERLIELLQEKRQALITQAVTKGLDANVAMKESGIEWLGLIPAHWQVVPHKHNMEKVVDCPHETPEYLPDGDYPIIGTAEVGRGWMNVEGAKRVSAETFESRVRRLVPAPGDILYSREGGRFGMAALVPEEAPVCLGQRMMLFRVKPEFDSRYFMWLMNSEAFFMRMKEETVGAASPRINIPTTLNVRVPRPPAEEQSAIADFIKLETSRIDAIVSKVEDHIGLLREYRQALLTEAVTGKLDVTRRSNNGELARDGERVAEIA